MAKPILLVMLLFVSFVSAGTFTVDNYICTKDSECAFPDKCYDTIPKCENFRCIYQTNACTKPQIVNYLLTLNRLDLEQPKIVSLNNGIETITFNTPKIVAGKNFELRNLHALKELSYCQVPRGEYLPTSREGCYEVKVNWGGHSFSIKNGEEIKINDYISIKYILSGRGFFNGIKQGIDYDYELVKPEHRTNTFEITFKNILDVDIAEYKERVLLNEDANIKLLITNNLFDLSDSGYKIKIIKEARDISLPTQTIKMALKDNTRLYIIPLPTDEFGYYHVEISPFFNIVDNKEYLGKQVVIDYYVSDKEFNCNEVGCSIGECQPDGSCLIYDAQEETQSKEKINYIPIIISAIIVIMLVAIAKKNG